MKDDFYSQFELSFRGKRSEIKDRLHVYTPFIEPLIHLYPDAAALDLGCGRGEWLELLQEKGCRGLGVDLDESMLADCKALGLNAHTQDALTALKACQDDSLSIVSAFHLVEHLAFEDVRTLVAEALRVLKPGGILILETPNPENLMVGASNFYMDPTHTRPIPPGLLKFVPNFYGFHQTTVLGLQESHLLRDKLAPTLQEVLGGASPDYAVIAQKLADEAILSRLSSAFALDAGLTIETLSTRYDAAYRQLHAASNVEVVTRLTAAEHAIAALNTRITDINNSTSWKITHPLRLLGAAMRWVKQRLINR